MTATPFPPPRYAPIRILGRGAQAVVWLAREEDRLVAVKLYTSDPGVARRREMAALLALGLPGVARLLDLGEGRDGDGRSVPCLVLEYVDGPAFPANGPLAWDVLRNPAVELLRVLRGVHAAGVVHRDLKPDNIRLRDGLPVLLDFGGAGGPGAGIAVPDGGAGDLRYMAPEQLFDPEGAGSAADLFAVGVMLYEALAGHPPHPLDDLVAARLRGGFTPLGTLRPDLPPEVAHLVDGLLRRHADERIATAESALATLGHGAAAELPHPWTFAGPERIFGRRSRATAVLRWRTAADPASADAEVSAWIGAGRAHRDGDAVVVPEADLAWLAEGIPLLGAPPCLGPPLEPEAHALVYLAWPGISPERLARAGVAVASVETLVAAGRVVRVPDGRLRAIVQPPGWEHLPEGARVPFHRRLADTLPRGERGRLRHLLAAGALTEGAEEASSAAEARFREGDVREALARVDLGLAVARALARVDPSAAARLEATLIADRARFSLSESTLASIERSRYENARSAAHDPEIELLLRAATAARSGRATSALELLDRLAPFPDERLDRWRLGLRMEAAHHLDRSAFEAAVASAEAWAGDRGTTTSRADVLNWQGMLACQQGDFATAARLQRASIDGKTNLPGRLSSAGNAAVSLLEIRDLDAAEAVATSLRDQAFAAGLPGRCAVAEWILRAARYRRGAAVPPDLELVEAARALGSGLQRAEIAFTEAAFAWRAGDRPLARDLAAEAADVWRSKGHSAVLMAEALVAANTDPPPAESIAVLGDRALDEGIRGPLPGLAMQALAILIDLVPDGRSRWGPGAAQVVAGLPDTLRRGIRELVDLARIFPDTRPDLVP